MQAKKTAVNHCIAMIYSEYSRTSELGWTAKIGIDNEYKVSHN